MVYISCCNDCGYITDIDYFVKDVTKCPRCGSVDLKVKEIDGGV